MGEIEHRFEYNAGVKLIEKLHQQISTSKNIQAARWFLSWLKYVLAMNFNVFDSYDWKLICFNVHVQYLGVPHMPDEFQEMFDGKFPRTKQDAANYLLFASERIQKHLENILSFTNLLAQGQSRTSHQNIVAQMLEVLEEFDEEQLKLNFILNYYSCIKDPSQRTAPYYQLPKAIEKLVQDVRRSTIKVKTLAGNKGVFKVNLSSRYDHLKDVATSYKGWLIDLSVEMENLSGLFSDS